MHACPLVWTPYNRLSVSSWQGEKRPAAVDISKKPKTPKKKKRKDPNEPVKPVSAYALFFRDTQANIKAQNPNATFGEVSKIVASMWDGLGEEQKQVELFYWTKPFHHLEKNWNLLHIKVKSFSFFRFFLKLMYL